MKLSLFLSAQLAPGEEAARHVRDLAEQVELAERLGFEGAFLPHHHLAGVPYLQALPLLGYLAATTSRIRLGTAVLLLPLRHPVALGEEVATLDVMSRGRITLGVGQGYREEEFEAFGVPPRERGRWLEESIDVMRRLWRGEAVTAEGRFGRLREARLSVPPVQPGGPPVWIGASGDRGVRRAAVLGDAWLISSSLRMAEIARGLELMRAARREAGLGPAAERPLLREASVAATREQAVATVRAHLGSKIEAYRRWGRARPDVDETIEQCCIAGTPEEAVARVLEYERSLGVNHLVLRVQWPGMAQAEALRTIRLLGEEVLPGVRSVCA